MKEFGDSGFTIVPFSRIWGITRKNVIFDQISPGINFDSVISLYEQTVWFTLVDNPDTYHAKSKTQETEHIFLKGNLMYMDLDKIYVEKTRNQ